LLGLRLKRTLVDDNAQTKMDINETTKNFTQRNHFHRSNTHHRIYAAQNF